MFPKPLHTVISGGGVAAMLVVAISEFQRGAALGEIHLITPAPLSIAATTPMTGTMYHPSAIVDTVYEEPADGTPLPLNGVTYPSA